MTTSQQAREQRLGAFYFVAAFGALCAFVFIAFDVLVQPLEKDKRDFMHKCVVEQDKSEWRCNELYKWR